MPSQPRKMTAFQWFANGAMFLFLAFVFSLNSHYFSSCPKAPNPETGQIYPLDNRGTFVYLTEEENNKMHLAEDSFWGVWLLGIGFHVVNWGLKKLRVP